MEHILEMPKYQTWFNAIKDGEISKIVEILDEAEPNEKVKLLKGTFEFESTVFTEFSKTFKITKPWTFAVVYSSEEVVKYLFKQDICPLQVDFNYNNCLHLLCYSAHLDVAPEQILEDRFHYVCQLLPYHDLGTLLNQEKLSRVKTFGTCCPLGKNGSFSMYIRNSRNLST